MMRFVWFGISFILALGLAGCGEQATAPPASEPADEEIAQSPRNIIANNAFFYYADLEGAWRFYEDILGLETVADYDFAKIMRVAPTSYLTLVDGKSGMHTADEPKTVAIALITDELDEWYAYLKTQDVSMRGDYNPVEGRPHHGFVVEDPEGYYLEFERFNPHPENERLMPMLDAIESLYPQPDASTKRPKELGFKATVLWLYYKDLEGIQRFYEDVMGFELVVDQGWAAVLRRRHGLRVGRGPGLGQDLPHLSHRIHRSRRQREGHAFLDGEKRRHRIVSDRRRRWLARASKKP
jgi:catechol 2,3-dioxygenase-like lactoylglutathione lyase family enzyme